MPSTYTGQDPVPLVMVLHGCRQTEVNMINETRFKDLAERDNFIVVYPFITSYDGMRETNCWGFFLDQHIHKGAGEVEDLHQIALEIEAELKIDPNRRYVTGLSSGAGMSVALAVAHSDYFAAAGSVEGLPYSETSSAVGFVCANPGSFKPVSADVVAMQTEQQQPEEQRPVPIMAIHSRNDCVVNKLGSENIRDAWIRRYGLSPSAMATLDCTAEGVPCTQTRYGTPAALRGRDGLLRRQAWRFHRHRFSLLGRRQQRTIRRSDRAERQRVAMGFLQGASVPRDPAAVHLNQLGSGHRKFDQHEWDGFRAPRARLQT